MSSYQTEHITLERYYNVCREYEGIWAAFSKACNMSPAESAVLYMIDEGCHTQAAICEALFMTKQTVHSAVKKLEDKGILTMQTPEGDHRTKKILLTEAGGRFLQETIGVLDEAERNVWKAMAPEEQEAIIRISQKYNRLLQKELEPFFNEKHRQEKTRAKQKKQEQNR